MDVNTMKSVLAIGETVAVEFKRCGNGIEHDTYESVCSFLNRFGGDLFLGVEDDGKVVGVPEKAAADMVKNFISVISNPGVFSPTVYLAPEIFEYEGCTLIHVHIVPSAEVHSYKRVIYDRVDDADVKVTATGQIAAMYIRKQNIFTEKRIYPYVTEGDLRLDLLPRLRKMARNYLEKKHPWEEMDDLELLKSARLYGTDHATGEKGYNLAGIMLLGKDDVIMDICPSYQTDALVRRGNVDRYDDREIIQTNLIESYEMLLDFARKHLLDKFFIEGTQRVSLRNIIAREILVNTLIHREFTSTYIAKFVIGQDKMYVENANRASREGYITPDNLEPNPKNPIIAAFFRNIGWADTLGSGVRNLFKYSKYYSGREPEFVEGDVFRIMVPLDDTYFSDADKNESIYEQEHLDMILNVRETYGHKFDIPCETAEWQYGMPLGISANKDKKSADKRKNADKNKKSADKSLENADKNQKSADKEDDSDITLLEVKKRSKDIFAAQQERIKEYILQFEKITTKEAAELLSVKQRRARTILSKIVENGDLIKQGNYKSTVYLSSKKDDGIYSNK